MNVPERYARLAHGVNTHQDGFIDSYIGPAEWREPVSTDFHALEAECDQLEVDIAGLEDASRRAFLMAQTQAMRTMLRFKRGEPMIFADEARGLYDIEPERTPEAVFTEALNVLETLLPGQGGLLERWQALRSRYLVPTDRLQDVLEVLNSEFRDRSKKLFALPNEERIELCFVQNQPWSGYNWYLGHAISRVDINTDLPKSLFELPDLIAHEGYPGHHTERIFKDQLQRQGHLEFSVQLLHAPEAVLAEGIATNALEFITTPEELPAWYQEIGKRIGWSLSLEEIQAFMAINQAREALDDVGCNAAIMRFGEGASDADVLEYVTQYALAEPEQARKRLEFIHHARAYIFTYSVGYRLVRNALGAGDRTAMYKRLLAEPITPGQLRAMA